LEPREERDESLNSKKEIQKRNSKRKEKVKSKDPSRFDFTLIFPLEPSFTGSP
jgi:hypothetical protein